MSGMKLDALDAADNECNEENETEGAARNCEGPFYEWALTLKNIAKDKHAALPTVLLIKGQDIGNREKIVHKTKTGTVGQDGGDQVGSYSRKQNNDLL